MAYTMRRRHLTVLAIQFIFSWGFAAAAAQGPAEPKTLGLKESVAVNLVTLEVTVWPKTPDTDACLGLTAKDFQLRVDGKPQEIYAVDSLGAELESVGTRAETAAGSPGGGMSLVLLFDLFHIDRAYHVFGACPPTKRLAFNEARAFVRSGFRDGDRLLLVTAAGWPVVHYGWIRTKEEGLKALDRLEKSQQVVMPRQDHSNHLGWIAGMESLFLALGRYSGRKDVIYLADDFRFDDVAMRMYEIAARAQANSVVVNAVDLLDSCRRVPGPPDCTLDGGLGCSDYRVPQALHPLTIQTGGELFFTDRITTAVEGLRSMRKCRYLISFRKDTRKSKRFPAVSLELTPDHKDLTLLAPVSFEPPARAPSKQDKDEALFLLPRFGRGIAADVALWPYRPSGKKGRWKSFVLARVEHTDDEPWPEELTKISVSVLPHKRSEDYGEYRKTITGDELAALRAPGGSKLMLFPFEGIRPGDTSVDVTVTSDVDEVSATVRRSFDVPEPPEPGEARPWFLSDRVMRIGDAELLTPSLDDIASPGESVVFIGYGCKPKSGTPPSSYSGRLVPFVGGASVAVPIAWLEEPSEQRGRCGWLVGRIGADLASGLWTFEPPPELGGRKGSAGVEFSVVSQSAPATPPSEVKLH